MVVPQLKIDLPYMIWQFYSVIFQREKKNTHTPIQKRSMHPPVLAAALLTIAKIRKQSKYPWIDEWIKEM